ncbi:hypothetical protein [Paenibacillus tianjinensis]|uniref:Uncharacterized protein n=1 Tax=Paenibacillus tianjinensis TaxID=2810347 RepID=A0ABX7LEM1_9BACL|nr:hypothetical protein [Paenibacillus tianjinensis]QSF45298.1 hypothetical protein JRJ22_01085 [Paenibacillus tianjinensis]
MSEPSDLSGVPGFFCSEGRYGPFFDNINHTYHLEYGHQRSEIPYDHQKMLKTGRLFVCQDAIRL